MVKLILFLQIILVLLSQNIYSQNLIANSSFSEVNTKQNKNIPFKITPFGSDVKHWYIPAYLKNLEKKYYSNLGIYYFIQYLSSRDREIVIAKKLNFYGEQLFEGNLGYIRFHFRNSGGPSILQQNLDKHIKGKYCLKYKFKYKTIDSYRNGDKKLEFVFSETDLKEYYMNGKFFVPDTLVKISLQIKNEETSDNIPWRQNCKIIELTGKEKVLSIGSLTNSYKKWVDKSVFFVDDVELYFIKDSSSCVCEVVSKDLRNNYNRDFVLNKNFFNDTLVMYLPNGRVAPGIITPDAKIILNQVISFLQRNPEIKLELLEHICFTGIKEKPSNTYDYFNYIRFFNISEDRLVEKIDVCKDRYCKFCKKGSEYARVGFYFYKE